MDLLGTVKTNHKSTTLGVIFSQGLVGTVTYGHYMGILEGILG
jgi:hypothetical protein